MHHGMVYTEFQFRRPFCLYFRQLQVQADVPDLLPCHLAIRVGNDPPRDTDDWIFAVGGLIPRFPSVFPGCRVHVEGNRIVHGFQVKMSHSPVLLDRMGTNGIISKNQVLGHSALWGQSTNPPFFGQGEISNRNHPTIY